MPSNHQHQHQHQHKYQDSPTAHSLASGRLESPSAERNKEPIWEVLSSQILSRLETNPSGEQQQQHQQQQQQPWRILEIAAGAGVHTEYMASRILRESTRTSASGSGDDNPFEFESESESEVPPPFVWYPTDPTEEALGSIRSRISSANLGKVVEEPEAVTLCASGIRQEQARNRLLRGTTKSNDDDDDDVEFEFDFKFDVILCINMIHISPWEATLGLMKLAGEHLRQPEEEQERERERDGSGGGGSGSGGGGGYLYCYGPYRHEGKIVPSNENFDRSLKSRNPEWGVRNLRDVVDAANREGLELVDCIDMPANNNSLIFRCRRRL